MLNRRTLFMTLAALAAAGPAAAEGYVDQVLRQLQNQGWSTVSVSRTMLGRSRIVAANGGLRREIILDPRTGEILRDLATGADGSLSSSVQISDNSGKGSSGSNSGSGSGSGDSSGSGSGGSGSGGSGSGGHGSDDDDDDDDHGGDDHGGDDHSGHGS